MYGAIGNQAHIGAINMNDQRGGTLAFSREHGGCIARRIKVQCRQNGQFLLQMPVPAPHGHRRRWQPKNTKPGFVAIALRVRENACG